MIQYHDAERLKSTGGVKLFWPVFIYLNAHLPCANLVFMTVLFCTAFVQLVEV